MKRITTKLTNFEPIINLLLQPASAFSDALKAAGKTPPAPVSVRALIDTGFTGGLAIEQSLVKSWELKPRNWNKVTVPKEESGRFYDTFAWEADVAIKFLSGRRSGGNVLLDPVPATLMEFVDSNNVQALIGQEILQVAVFSYDGLHRVFSLNFDAKS